LVDLALNNLPIGSDLARISTSFKDQIINVSDDIYEVDEEFLLICTQLQRAMCSLFKLVCSDENYEDLMHILDARANPDWSLGGISLAARADESKALNNKAMICEYSKQNGNNTVSDRALRV
jgi:hypothetical protein